MACVYFDPEDFDTESQSAAVPPSLVQQGEARQPEGEAGGCAVAAASPTDAPSVFAVSDLHTDYQENRCLFKELPTRPSDAVLLAGDISDDMAILKETLRDFTAKFGFVFYCPGNHDLWLRGKATEKQWSDSLEKWRDMEQLCEELGVHTKPKDIGGGVLIVPMLSWYEPEFDHEPAIEHESLPPVEQAMMDFSLCNWPRGFSASDSSLASHFDALNPELPCTDGYKAVISFSHFLPRLELLPEKRYLFFPPLMKVVGSRPLGARVSKLKPHCHVFGHTHYGWSMELDGTHFLQAAVAYPGERRNRGFSLNLKEGEQAVTKLDPTKPLTAADFEGGVTSPILVYDGHANIFPRYKGFWSSYYSLYARRPSDVRWLYRPPRNLRTVAPILKRLIDSGKEVDDDVVEDLLRQAR